MNRPLLAAFALLTLAPSARVVAEDTPPIFDQRPYAEARQAAEKAGKWFIVKATAVWCAPCKQMDRTTWRDEKVVQWLTGHAVAVTVDVDKQRDIVKDLAIEAMPTMIAFKQGKEFDRIVGYQSPADFLAWLEAIERGETSMDRIRKRAGSRDPADGLVDVHARMELAQQLVQHGKLDEAADEYVWLWDNMLKHNMSMYGVRLSFMASDMERLAKRHPAAKKRFTQLRDRAAKGIDDEDANLTQVNDWITLNRIINDEKETLIWFDRVKKEPGRQHGLSRLSHRLEELLIEEKRWADLGRIYADPIEALQYSYSVTVAAPHFLRGDELTEARRKAFDALRSESFRRDAGNIYAALLAAGRDDEAEKLAERARTLDESPEMLAALIATALKADQPRAEQIAWLDQAAVAKPRPEPGSKPATDTAATLSRLRDDVQAALKAKD